MRELVAVPTEPETLIALTDDGRLLRSKNGGHHWEVVYMGEDETRPRAIGLDYQPPHTFYLLTRQGLYRSSDYGEAFEFVHGLTGTAVSISFEHATHLWVGGGDEPVMKSEDGGQHWRSASIGLSAYRLASPIFINPRDGNMLLVITQGPRGGAALYRGTREGAWTRLPGPSWLLPTGNNPIGLAWDNDQRIVYTGDADGKLYRSLNAEALDQTTVTWEVSYIFDPPRLPIVLAMGQGPTLYLTLYDYLTNSGPLLRGTQGEAGWSWQEIVFPE